MFSVESLVSDVRFIIIKFVNFLVKIILVGENWKQCHPLVIQAYFRPDKNPKLLSLTLTFELYDLEIQSSD